MLVQRVLHLARVHVVSATDYQIFLAVDDVVETIAIDATDVTGAQPPILDSRLGRVGQVPIALHDIVAADLNFAGSAHGHVAAVLVDYPYLHAVDGRADGTDLAKKVREVVKEKPSTQF